MRFQDFIDKYQDGHVQITDDISYSLRDVINKNIRLKHGQFEDDEYPNGQKKIFYNLGHIMHQTIYRSTDLDTKNLQISALNQDAIKRAPLIKGALKNYLKESEYGTEMNLHRSNLIDGHLLVKEVDNRTKTVNLLNVVRPPHIMDLQEGGLAEKTLPSAEHIRSKEGQWENWDKVEMVQDHIEEHGGNIVVYEHWTEDEFTVKGKKKFIKGCIKYLDFNPVKNHDPKNNDWQSYYELERFATPKTKKIISKAELKRLRDKGIIGKDEDEVPVYPYKERRFYTLEGRWLGVGVWELLAGIMEHYNKNWGFKAMFDELANKGILVLERDTNTDGQSLTQELINNIPFGGIADLEVGESLKRLDMGSITVDHLATVDKLMELARQIMGISALFLGEDVNPSSATEARIQQNNAKTAYAVVIEELALFYMELFKDFKIKTIIDELTEEDAIKVIGDEEELKEMERQYIENLVKAKAKKAFETRKVRPMTNEFPPEEFERVVGAVEMLRAEEKGVRFAEFKKDIIKGIEFNIEFDVNNEAMDKVAMLQEINMMIQQAMANPMSKMSVDKLMEAKLDLMNINPSRFKKSREEIEQAMQTMQMPTQLPAPNPQPQA